MASNSVLELWRHALSLWRRAPEAILTALGLYMIYSREAHGGGTVATALTFGAGCVFVAAGITIALVRSRAPAIALELEPSSDLTVAVKHLGKNYDLLMTCYAARRCRASYLRR